MKYWCLKDREEMFPLEWEVIKRPFWYFSYNDIMIFREKLYGDIHNYDSEVIPKAAVECFIRKRFGVNI